MPHIKFFNFLTPSGGFEALTIHGFFFFKFFKKINFFLFGG